MDKCNNEMFNFDVYGDLIWSDSNTFGYLYN